MQRYATTVTQDHLDNGIVLPFTATNATSLLFVAGQVHQRSGTDWTVAGNTLSILEPRDIPLGSAIELISWADQATVTPGDLSALVAEMAATPKSLRNDEGSVEERSIQELIQADVYSRNGNATAVPWGMSVARTKPGGTV